MSFEFSQAYVCLGAEATWSRLVSTTQVILVDSLCLQARNVGLLCKNINSLHSYLKFVPQHTHELKLHLYVYVVIMTKYLR